MQQRFTHQSSESSSGLAGHAALGYTCTHWMDPCDPMGNCGSMSERVCLQAPLRRRSGHWASLPASVRLLVEWAAHGFGPSIEDMGIDHGGLHVLMSEQFLHGPNIVAGFQQLCGERVPERISTLLIIRR